ncbi:MAG TPA: transglutaminase, partial [Candidatus Angelobacter sp.]
IDKELIIRYKFTAEHYAKSAGPLLLVRPRVVGENAGRFDPTKPRHYAYKLDAPFRNTDSVEITLPDGFKVDELPDPAKASFPFGEYSSKTEASGNTLKYTREYRMTTTLVSLDRIEQLKRLFSEINMDEKSMAVLKKSQ